MRKILELQVCVAYALFRSRPVLPADISIGRTHPVSCTANRSADGTATCCRSGEGRGGVEGGASHVQVVGSGTHAEPFRPHGPLPFPSTTIGCASRPFHARSDPRMNKSLLLFGSRLGHCQPSPSTVVAVFAIRFDPNRGTVPRFVPPSVLCLVPLDQPRRIRDRIPSTRRGLGTIVLRPRRHMIFIPPSEFHGPSRSSEGKSTDPLRVRKDRSTRFVLWSFCVHFLPPSDDGARERR